MKVPGATGVVALCVICIGVLAPGCKGKDDGGAPKEIATGRTEHPPQPPSGQPAQLASTGEEEKVVPIATGEKQAEPNRFGARPHDAPCQVVQRYSNGDLSNWWSFWYGESGRVEKARDEQENVRVATAKIQPRSEVDAKYDKLPWRITYEYDAAGRLKSVTDQDNAKTVAFEYGGDGKLTRYTKADGANRILVDGQGRVAKVTTTMAGLGEVATRYAYADAPTRGSSVAHPTMPDAAAPAVTGTVVEVLPSGHYTFLKLKTADGDEWAAVKAEPVEVGERVRIVAANLMENFKSASLKRVFAKLWFGSLDKTGPAIAASLPTTKKANGGEPIVYGYGNVLFGQRESFITFPGKSELRLSSVSYDGPNDAPSRVQSFDMSGMKRDYFEFRYDCSANPK